MSELKVELEPAIAGRRRRYTPEQKRTLLEEAERPGESTSMVARRYGISPSVMVLWRRAMKDAGDEGLKSQERVVPESEAKKLEARIRELERALGRKTMDNEILTEALKLTQEKKRRSLGSSSKGGNGP
ncbi:MAG: transposase [Myxococcota bacterium]